MKAHEFDRVVRKLEMETRDTDHIHCWFVHEGVTVARTKRSHGKGKFLPEYAIRSQLHVTQDQFVGLHSCTVSKADYIEILVDKGVIAKKVETVPQADSGKKPARRQRQRNSRD